jgi:hypothetical protein
MFKKIKMQTTNQSFWGVDGFCWQSQRNRNLKLPLALLIVGW